MEERLFNALSKLRSDGPGVRKDSPTLRPFILEDGDGGTWTAFTDGYQMAVVRGAHPGVEPYDGGYKSLRTHLYPYLSTTYGDGEEHWADFKELATWIGVPDVDKCPVCCQSGHREADADRLLNALRQNLGALYGVAINRNLLAYTFSYLRAEALQIIVRPEAPLLFVAPTWRLLLSPCRSPIEGLDSFPQWAVEARQAA